MKRFFKKLYRGLLATGPARRGSAGSRRTRLQAEGLEDRVVLSSATMIGSTLDIVASPGATIELYELNPTGNRQIEVLGVSSKPPTFSINSIAATTITVTGQDSIYINDSDGMPFVTGATIELNGSGAGNSIDFLGSRAIDTGGDYIVGGTAANESSLLMDGLTFQFNSAFSSVTDSIQLTGGPLDVATAGSDVVLSSPYSGAQMLSGLGAGGGGTLIYSNMSTVDLNEYAADATVTLDTSAAASLESQFSVATYGAGDTVVIAATPSSASTGVTMTGSGSETVLEGNSGAVSVSGVASSSTMIIGEPQGNGGDSTYGVQGDVQASNLKSLIVADNGNVSTKETVTVTQSSISGVGLFGNNAADVGYSNVQTVSLFSGQLEDSYTVEASSSSAKFTSQINIFDDSSEAFSAHVDLDANTNLSLSLFNETSKAGELYISAPGGKFSNSSGAVDVYFDGVLSSQIDFQGFNIEEEHS